jgi:hypothetical protein
MDNHENELVHWGIKGMQWGRRRYQTKDGKLTPAGRKRYADDVAREKAKTEKLANKVKAKNAQDRAQARVEKLLAEQKKLKAQLKGKKPSEENAETGESRAKAILAKLNLKAAKQAKKDAEAKAKAEAKARKEQEIEDDIDNKIDIKQKQKIIRAQDPEKVLKNAHLFSVTELKEARDRINVENEIRKAHMEQIDKGQIALNKAKMTSDKISSIVDNYTKSAVTGYDRTVSIINALPAGIKAKLGFADKELPTASGYVDWARRRGEAAKAEREEAEKAAKEANEKARTDRAQEADTISREEFLNLRGKRAFNADEIKRMQARWQAEDAAERAVYNNRKLSEYDLEDTEYNDKGVRVVKDGAKTRAEKREAAEELARKVRETGRTAVAGLLGTAEDNAAAARASARAERLRKIDETEREYNERLRREAESERMRAENEHTREAREAMNRPRLAAPKSVMRTETTRETTRQDNIAGALGGDIGGLPRIDLDDMFNNARPMRNKKERRKARRDDVRQQQIRDAQRRVVPTLKAMGMSIKDIAKQMNMSEDEVKSILYSG